VDPYYGDTSFFFDPSSALVEGEGGLVEDEGLAEPPPPLATQTVPPG
ncbi:MAG: hypothetical protein IT382_24020, partial [Deltaproteobacteria bacterium]|nr:hypothetical protein [Deltaproteobacteria bacterium]